MPAQTKPPKIRLPLYWPRRVKSAMLHVISLAQYAAAYTHGWAASSLNKRIRVEADNNRLITEHLLLREEIRIKDTRMERIPPQRRPHYEPTERMAILELRDARGWSMEQTARVFLVTQATIASWMKRVDEDGPDALVQLRQPVNRFPDFVRYAVQRLKVVCPTMGKVKIAQVLCRAGLHLGSTTVGRILKEQPRPTPEPTTAPSERKITSRGPNHIWHIDLTTVPIAGGFWATWLPFAPTATLALLLLVGACHQQLLAKSHGIHSVSRETELRRNSRC